MKGQMTVVNVVGFVLALLLYLAFSTPINDIVNTTVNGLNAAPNSYTALTVALIQMILFFFLLMIIISGLNYAVPRREGAY